MKKLLVLLTLISSLSSFGHSWHGEKKTLADAMEYIQQNYSYHCGMETKSKRKMFFNCTTDNSMTFIKVKLKPGKGDITDRVQKVTFDFLNSEDGQYTITDAYRNIYSTFSHLCGAKKAKVLANGNVKSKWGCQVQHLGRLEVETEVSLVFGDVNPVKEFKVTFTK